ncbi:DUF397 domain-containing protein [Nocardiopsis quinghaiensis]|uniref:DUF397 domain-containing protein n=1 Tax=Nocardiopsis quinghaiensis TaxID=464995 RepID=UPI001239B1B0|nr:DUF397 domain-containing protein [Nocardiopsis quinghaiensis]
MFVDQHSTVWFKSSYSQGEAACVEVAHVPTSFRKSSYSGHNGNCVEVADAPGFSAVRDTQHRDHGTLIFGPAEWRVFLSTAKEDLS